MSLLNFLRHTLLQYINILVQPKYFWRSESCCSQSLFLIHFSVRSCKIESGRTMGLTPTFPPDQTRGSMRYRQDYGVDTDLPSRSNQRFHEVQAGLWGWHQPSLPVRPEVPWGPGRTMGLTSTFPPGQTRGPMSSRQDYGVDINLPSRSDQRAHEVQAGLWGWHQPSLPVRSEVPWGPGRTMGLTSTFPPGQTRGPMKSNHKRFNFVLRDESVSARI